MIKFQILIIFFFLQISSTKIPKSIWSYVPNESNMNTLQRLCLNNIKKYAQQSGYVFHLLNSNNYLQRLQDKYMIPIFLQKSQLDPSVSLPAMIQLQILKQKGGFWIDSSVMLVENLNWIQTLKNQKFINNRIDNYSVVLFYQSSWFDQTKKVAHPKTQDLVLFPHYKSWFMAVQKGAAYIQHLLALYKDIATKSYQQNVASLSEAGYEIVDYLLDQSLFFEWTMRLTVQMQQKKIIKQYKLAVVEYRISAIQTSKSAQVVQSEAKGHVDLTCKYLAEQTIEQLDINLQYMIRFNNQIALQLFQTLEKDYVNLDRFHSTGDLYCDQKYIPLRYIVNDSVIEKYLIRLGLEAQFNVYDSDYIRHHCEGSFVQVYVQVFTKYLLPVFGVMLNMFLLRKALNIFKPQSGVLPQNVFKNQQDHIY